MGVLHFNMQKSTYSLKQFIQNITRALSIPYFALELVNFMQPFTVLFYKQLLTRGFSVFCFNLSQKIIGTPLHNCWADGVLVHACLKKVTQRIKFLYLRVLYHHLGTSKNPKQRQKNPTQLFLEVHWQNTFFSHDFSHYLDFSDTHFYIVGPFHIIYGPLCKCVHLNVKHLKGIRSQESE